MATLGLLDGDVIEIIRRRHTQHAEDEALNQIGRGQLDALPSAAPDKQRQQHQQRERCAGLREDQRVDGMQRFPSQREFPGEYRAPERS